MRLKSLIGLATLIGAAMPLSAQGVNSQCVAGAAQDACQKTVDIFHYLAPQLGVIISGGNATLGVGGPIGGLGRIYVSGRANIVSADIPRVNQITPSLNGARSDQYPTQSQIAGIPQADVAIGIFRGIPLGVTNVGGLDLLVNATYLPSVSTAGVNLHVPNGSLKFGAGARLGIIQESILFPGISVTYLRRSLPTVDVLAASGGDTLHVDGLDITTDSWRVVASKSLLGFGIAAGVGQDHYSSDASASAYVTQCPGICPAIFTPTRVGPIALTQKLTRTTYFVDGSLNLLVLRLIAEIGRTGSVNVPTFNTFAGSAPGAARTFGALGVRVGL
ncbi:MAG: hypothetical protein ACR2M1_04925 [Gemmatimonadaceae bacterium]